jgi:hypothetical protein
MELRKQPITFLCNVLWFYAYGLRYLAIIIVGFRSSSVNDLWYINVSFPYKNLKVCEVVRKSYYSDHLKERNIIIFEEGNGKSVRTLGSSIISLVKYWSLSQGKKF